MSQPTSVKTSVTTPFAHMHFASLVLFVAACTTTPNTAPSSSPSAPPASTAPSGPAKVGDRMTPIAAPIAIPVKGARLTLVNYFATWCTASQRWLPRVEEMRRKHAAAGLAVVGVGNVDEAPLAHLELFVKENGGAFPVSADTDHQIRNALPPSGWGQAIIVVDAKGIVRLVHRGSREGDFEKVDAEIARLLATTN